MANTSIFAAFERMWQHINLALSNKSDTGHAHTITNITNLQSTLDGKANTSHGNHVPTIQTANNAIFLRNDNTWQNVTPANIGAAAASHGTHVSYSTTVPVMDGTAAVGSASTVARSDHKHPTDTSRAAASDLAALQGLVGDVAVSEQIDDAFDSAITGLSVSGKTITYTKGDGSTGTITTQDTNTVYTHPSYTSKSAGLYKVTVDGTGHVSAATAVAKSDITALGIPAQDTTYAAASTSAAGLMSASDKSKLDGIATGANKTTVDTALSSTSTNPVQNKVVNSAISNLNTLVGDTAVSEQISEAIDDVTLSSLGVTATATELNYVDGVTSNVQAQLDGKAPLSHTQSATTITTGTFSGNVAAYNTNRTGENVRNINIQDSSGTNVSTSSILMVRK